MRVLITGGAGYLGSVLTGQLLDKGFKVRVLDNLLYTRMGAWPYRKEFDFEFIKGDVRHIETVRASLEDVDAVIHLAAVVGDPACSFGPMLATETNLYSTKILADMAAYCGVKRFVFASTCSVYGSVPEIATESHALNPLSLYAEDKIKAEEAIWQAGIPATTILRMGTLYGLSPRPRFDLAVNILAAKAAINGEFTVYGGSQWRPFVHVADAAKAFCLALDIGAKGIFNVGSEEGNVTLETLGSLIIQLIPKSKMRTEPGEKDHRDYRIDVSKICDELGFMPTRNLVTGIKEVARAVSRGLDYQDIRYSNYAYLVERREQKVFM